MTETLTSPEVELLEQLVDQQDLIVYNDDINSFDHVINALIKICKHEVEQAEQCTWIIHYKGKCSVKRGDYETLAAMCTALHDKGISAEVE
jgi:ATP-dependent Clp protease adaptor protein ClpS